jgi:zeaxanthin glucosyltransferase
MTHFGILCPAAIGHLNPMCAIGRELIQRGHRVTLFGVPDVQIKVAAAGLEFGEIGAQAFPPGKIDEIYQQLGVMSRLAGLKFTVKWLQQETAMLCAEAPAAIQAQGIELLIVDQITRIGGTIADFLKLPFVTICNALPINTEPSVPPFFTHWTYQTSPWARVRNQVGNRLLEYLTKEVWQAVLTQRQAWGLPGLADRDASYSQLAQICQLPPGFDFPRERLSRCMHYTGPFQDPHSSEPVKFAGPAFPFDQLTGQPLIYASLGTLQNRQWRIFECIAAACATLDVQLVLSLANPQLDPTSLKLAGNPIVVAYAPQSQLIARASLVITHGGLNTVMGSLGAGVPMVVIPITNDQPGVASRVVQTGAGERIAPKQLQTEGLQQLIVQVLTDANYRTKAQAMQQRIQQSGGVRRAADIIIASAPPGINRL